MRHLSDSTRLRCVSLAWNSLASLALALTLGGLTLAGCPRSGTPGPGPDGGSGNDGGGIVDLGRGADASPGADASTGTDASVPGDASAPPDATTQGVDATIATDAGATNDGSAAPPVPPASWTRRWPPAGAKLCETSSSNPSGTVYPTALTVRGGTIFVGTNCGELYRSTDAAQTWQPIPAPPSSSPIGGTASKLPVNGFASTGTLLFAGFAGAGVYETPDDGATWNNFNAGLPSGPRIIYGMEIIGGQLYIATYGAGVLTTDVNQANWVAINGRDPNADPAVYGTYIETCPNAPGYTDPQGNPLNFLSGLSLAHDTQYLYYGNKCGGVFRTPLSNLPAAANWTAFDLGAPFFSSYYQDPFSLYFDGAFLYLGVDDEGIYRTSAPALPNWKFASSTLALNGGSTPIPKIDPLCWDRIGHYLFVGARFGGLHYTDMTAAGYGDTQNPTLLWVDVGPGPGSGADTVFAIAHDATHVYAATETGLYVGQ
ncbi:MAG TPA: hypothetical protein VH877_33525 [Polyangia bacterium]|nr:hypothetical protein [Polyangia bacterium]